MKNSYLNVSLNKALLTIACLLTSNAVYADKGCDLPFNSTLETLKNAITGPFLLSASIIMIVITCMMLAFGEWGDGFKKLINIGLWLSIAFSASAFVTTMFANSAAC